MSSPDPIYPDKAEFLFRRADGNLGFDGEAYYEARINAWVAWVTDVSMEETKSIIAYLRGRDPLSKCLFKLPQPDDDTRFTLLDALRASPANDIA